MAMAAAAVLALAIETTPALARTYTVNTLDDSSGNSDCSLRDAINAANGTPASGSTCTKAGKGNDKIQFSVTGTISLASTLPQVTDSKLAISGPPSPGITIDGGGAVQVMAVSSGATLNLKNLTIAHGLSDTSWGGILNDGKLTVTNSTFSGNFTSNGGAANGGGIANEGSLTVTNSTFFHNFALNGGGGAILNDNDKMLTVSNSTFSSNGAQDGGGIENTGTLTITNSTFSMNVAGPGFGGGIHSSGDTLTIANSTFFENGGEIGGVEMVGGTITNSTFYGNGIAVFGSATITNSTLFNEEIPLGSTGTVTFKSTILAGSRCETVLGVLTIVDAGHNISDNDSCGFSATGSRNNTDPMLNPAGLQNNGGPTRTIALSSESPAIDAIPVADCTDQSGRRLKTDQRGFRRPDAGERVCDIGAFETQARCSQNQQGNNNCQ
jgi:CSLREA domain-containing protein